MVFKCVIGIAMMAYLVAISEAYSGGAPVEVCEDMTPKHPASPKKTDMPYTVSVSDEAVSGGGLVKITVAGESEYKGFLVQVRHGDEPVGKFVGLNDHKYIKTINCGKGEQVIFEMFRQFVTFFVPELKRFFPDNMLQNAATHKNSELKKTITLDWQAPEGLKDTVQVYVTVAQDGGTYWVRRPTATIKVN